VTDRQFDKRLKMAEARITRLEKNYGELLEAVLTMSNVFLTLASFLSQFQRKQPPDDPNKIKVTLN